MEPYLSIRILLSETVNVCSRLDTEVEYFSPDRLLLSSIEVALKPTSLVKRTLNDALPVLIVDASTLIATLFN